MSLPILLMLLLLSLLCERTTAFAPSFRLNNNKRTSVTSRIRSQVVSTTPSGGTNSTSSSSSHDDPFLVKTVVHPPVLSPTDSTTSTSSKLQAPPQELQQEDDESIMMASSSSPRQQGTAIVLNVNARSVTKDVVHTAKQVFGESNVFVTRSEQDAQEAAREIMGANYSLIIPVGGDGTLSSMIQCLVEANMCDNNDSYQEAMARLPHIAYIPLGTGNGVGSVVGCHVQSQQKQRKRFLPVLRRKKRFLHNLKETLERLESVGETLRQQQQDDITTYSYNNNDVDVVELPMMKVTTPDSKYLCFFAGVGFDSLMLNDFKQIKAWSVRTGIFKKTLSSVTGYCVALVVKTLPRCILRQEHNIRVHLTTSTPQETLWVDHRRGDVARPARDGTNLFTGTTGILAAGTSPFYGGNLRLFPFARMHLDKMHLRIGRIHPLVGFFNIPSIFAGHYRDKSEKEFGCIDLLGTEFDIEIQDDQFPFQHSGESVGHVQHFHLQVIFPPIKFISFMEPTWQTK